MMVTKSKVKTGEGCIATGLMRLLSKKWMLIILRNLYDKRKMRFNKIIMETIPISSRTLSKRLKELEKAKIVKKEMFHEIPPRVEYSLTPAGKELIEGFKKMDNWVKKHGVRL